MANSIMIINPHYDKDTWIFSDSSKDIVDEPFVVGVPEMIDILVKDRPNAKAGFKLIFSANPFPGFQLKLNWLREETGRNWYKLELGKDHMQGWLCPVLYQYFEVEPKVIYVKAEELKK